MFDSQAFRSWPHILVGACCFALLFGVAVAMGEALFDGTIRLTRTVAGFGACAFLGYVGVALILRNEGGGG